MPHSLLARSSLRDRLSGAEDTGKASMNFSSLNGKKTFAGFRNSPKSNLSFCQKMPELVHGPGHMGIWEERRNYYFFLFL